MSVSDGLDAATLAVTRVAAEHADVVDRGNCIPEATLASMRREGLLSLLVPRSLGGQERSLSQVAAVCHSLAQSCGSSGMIHAMHHIEAACIVAHGMRSDWHRELLQRLVREQLLLGSVTSEVGTGGNIHASVCGLETAGGTVSLEKNATTISYGTAADGLLITARRSLDAAASDQIMLVALRGDYALERTSAWDALGMRGTCSEGFRVRASAGAEQVLPVPFVDIASQTMLPVSHLLWTSVWLGIAADAVVRARKYLRQQALSGRGALSPGGHRLAKAVGLLQLMQSRLAKTLRDYEGADGARPLPLGFTADMNNLKTSVSELCLEVVQHAFMVCGINAYRNGSEFSLGRHLRDLMSAPIMINNDRILESTGNLLLMQRPALGVF
jgi:acyl-CoA dehydrogenase